MDYNKLKKDIKEIVDISNDVPENFQEKCFEILLQNYLIGKTKVDEPKLPKTPTPPTTKPTETIPTTAQIRVFMKRQKIDEDNIKEISMYVEDDLHFLKEPTTNSPAKGQIQWALLLALKNGILNNNLSVDPEDVRSICQEKGFYDKKNFKAIFKRPRNAILFKKTLEPQGEAQQLSNVGEIELGKLIKSLASSE